MREQWAFLAKTTEGKAEKLVNFKMWSRQRKETVQSCYPGLFKDMAMMKKA
ncbi:MAG: hypothetical protein KJ597_06355 [Nanoarchaeota archaeon]|nr:hypothetical protein [Nanoarchaeota archaeon]MBU1623169.1 hypothetical protein [Nanoarchaeota archaeon]